MNERFFFLPLDNAQTWYLHFQIEKNFKRNVNFGLIIANQGWTGKPLLCTPRVKRRSVNQRYEWISCDAQNTSDVLILNFIISTLSTKKIDKQEICERVVKDIVLGTPLLAK